MGSTFFPRMGHSNALRRKVKTLLVHVLSDIIMVHIWIVPEWLSLSARCMVYALHLPGLLGFRAVDV